MGLHDYTGGAIFQYQLTFNDFAIMVTLKTFGPTHVDARRFRPNLLLEETLGVYGDANIFKLSAVLDAIFCVVYRRIII